MAFHVGGICTGRRGRSPDVGVGALEVAGQATHVLQRAPRAAEDACILVPQFLVAGGIRLDGFVRATECIENVAEQAHGHRALLAAEGAPVKERAHAALGPGGQTLAELGGGAGHDSVRQSGQQCERLLGEVPGLMIGAAIRSDVR